MEHQNEEEESFKGVNQEIKIEDRINHRKESFPRKKSSFEQLETNLNENNWHKKDLDREGIYNFKLI